jgi:hypothetical protein
VPYYCVNTNPQPNGDHEVHDTGTCSRLPLPLNRLDLGFHLGCHSAVAEARRSYARANGCYWCSIACHTT